MSKCPRGRGGAKANHGANRGANRGAGRGRTERLLTAKGRTSSSARWLQRQLADTYVAEAKARGLRSRAAFKLIELDDRFRFLKPGLRVVDLGAAPGGWSTVAASRVNANGAGRGKRGRVVAIDLEEMGPVAGCAVIRRDFLDADAPGLLTEALGGPADVVLSDMAAPATGHAATDHLRVMALLEAAFTFACEVLAPGGVFVGKAYQGGAERQLLAAIKCRFKSVRHAKPPASRAESAETYVVATGFKG
ncbi:MAG: RlmE family RNA methyltransferase [Rhodospirillales bacterium]